MKHFIFSIFLLITIVQGLSGQMQTSFSSFVQSLYTVDQSRRSAMVDSFMSAQTPKGFPVLEDSTAHFIYYGDISSRIAVTGDHLAWSTSGETMTNVNGTKLHFLTKNFESTARLDYKFIRDGAWILDPLNQATVLGGFGPNSELAMPGYEQPAEIKFYPDIPHGILRDTVLYSINLGNSRTIRIYTPPGYEGSKLRYPVIFFHDGLEYVSLANADNVIDYLIFQKKIEPIIAVFIPPVNRTAEYAGNQVEKFSAFIVNEILPYVDSLYRTKATPASRAVAGASNGGNISLWLGLFHSHIFGNVAAHSSNVVPAVSSGFQNSTKVNLRLYLDIGTYDIDVLKPMVQNLKTILEAKGYDLQYHQYHEGHSWGNWRAHIDNYLIQFFPYQPSIVRHHPVQVAEDLAHLLPPFPNPFNPMTTITISVPVDQHIRVVIIDLLGHEVAVLIDDDVRSGEYRCTWDASHHATGIYYCRLETQSRNAVRKLVLLK